MRLNCLASLAVLSMHYSSAAGLEPPPAGATTGAASRTDTYGDPLPEGALSRLGTIRFSVPGGLHDVNYTPDGKTLAAVVDGAIAFWDPHTGKEVRRLTSPPDEDCFHGSFWFSPDGKRLVETGFHSVHVWDLEAGKPLLRLDGDYRLRGLAFSSDGKRLAVCGGRDVKDKPGTDAKVLNAASGAELCNLGESNGPIAYSPDGCCVAVGCGAHIFLCDPATGTRRLEIVADQKQASVLMFTPDGGALASAGEGGAIRLWDAGTGKPILRFTGHEHRLLYLRFSRDGKTMTSVDDASTAIVWDAKNGDKIRTLELPIPTRYRPVDVAPDAGTLAVGDGDHVRIWDLSSGKERRAGSWAGSEAIAFSPDGETVATAKGRDDGEPSATIQLWDKASGKLLREWPSEDSVASLDFSPDGKALASASGGGPANHAGVQLWDAASGRPRVRIEAPAEGGECIRFSRDGKTLSLMNHTGVFTMNAETGRAACSVALDGLNPREHLAFAADARWVAVGIADGASAYRDQNPKALGGPDLKRFYVRDASSGKTLREFGGPFEGGLGVGLLAVSPDGKELASTARGFNLLQLWETGSGEEIPNSLLNSRHYSYSAMAYSPDGSLLAVGDEGGGVYLLESITGKEVKRFQGRGAWVTNLAFSADGAVLASAEGNSDAILWDVTGRVARPAPDLGPKALDGLWADLAGESATRAFEARQALAAAGKQSAPFLLAHLKTTAPSPERLARLLTDLDADDFDSREGASAELSRLGGAAEKALRKARGDGPSVEAAHRIDELLAKLEGAKRSPDGIRMARAMAALENAKAPEARQALEELAKGPAGVPATDEAKAALGRLGEP